MNSEDSMQCSSMSCGTRRRRRLPLKPNACYKSYNRMSPVVPTIVRNVSAVASNQHAVTVPSDQVNSEPMAVASSPLFLSGSTFPDSDNGYFGSIGLYEGSCDHLESDYGRRYSVELADDTEVFTECAEVAYSQIPVDSYVMMSCSESPNAMPGRSNELDISDKEQFDVAMVDADSESMAVSLNEQHDDVASASLSDKICHSKYSNTDITIPEKPATADAVGLSEVASKYKTVQLLLEMNQQRAGLGAAEDLSFDYSSSEYQPLACLDRKALASLATNYCVIKECLQLGAVGQVSKSKRSKADDSSERGQTLTRECIDAMSEQSQAVEISAVSSANVIDSITLVKDFNANLSYDGQITKDPSHHTNDAEQLDENVSAVLRETEMCKFDGGKPASLVSPGDLCLMYLATEDPCYYPVYGRLRDVETGVIKTFPHVTDNDAMIAGSTTEMVAVSEQEHIRRNTRDADKDTANGVSVHYAIGAKYPDPITTHTESSVVNYSSLALLSDVENGNVLVSYMPAHAAVDVHLTILPVVDKTSSKQKSRKHVNVSEVETKNPEHRDLSDEDHCRLAKPDDDSQSDGFTVIQTKKHRRQKKKQDVEDPAVQNSSLSKSPTSFNEIHSAAVQYNYADTEEAQPSVPLEAEERTFAEGLSEAGTEGCLIQNSSLEVNPCTDELAAVPAMNFEIKTVPLVQAVVTDEAITGTVPDHAGPQKSELVEAQLDRRVLVSALTSEGPASAAKQKTTDMETLPVSVMDDEDNNRSQEAVSHVAIEPELREQVENDARTTEVYIAEITEKTVTNVALEPQPAVAAVTELAFMNLRAAAPEPLASASNETVRVERLITVTPRSVVKVTVEPSAENKADLFAAPVIDIEKKEEKTINTGDSVSEAADASECTATVKAVTEMEHEPEVSETAVGQVETDLEADAAAFSRMSQKKAHQTFESLRFSEISESADIKTKATKLACMPHDEIKTEKCVSHYASLAILGDVESGRVHKRLKASRFLQEWDTKNVDDIVAYIVGSEAKKHRKKHKHIKRASESEVSEVRDTENDSEMMTISMLHAKSEENILWTDEQAEKLETVTTDHVEEQTVEESENGSEGESFTVVESRKHRRQRHKHDAEEMWAHYLDDVDAAGPETEQSEILESFAESLPEPTCNNAETVLEHVTDSLDANGVLAVAVETVNESHESVIDIPPMTSVVTENWKQYTMHWNL